MSESVRYFCDRHNELRIIFNKNVYIWGNIVFRMLQMFHFESMICPIVSYLLLTRIAYICLQIKSLWYFPDLIFTYYYNFCRFKFSLDKTGSFTGVVKAVFVSFKLQNCMK